MICYLDTKDLIDILEHSRPIAAPDFERALSQGGHTLAISVETVMEIAAPLWRGTQSHKVWQVLGKLEDLPLAYLHSSAIPRLELQEAVDAFTKGREYRDILPFVNRFDKIVDFNGTPVTAIIIEYSLCECVWDLYTSGAENGLERFVQRLRESFARDRATTRKLSLKANFISMIERNLRLHRIDLKFADVRALGRWVHENSSRCPAERLSYEVYHKILKNTQDIPKDSDLEDSQHISCIPYVDAITLDGRKRGYILQASTSLAGSYEKRVFGKVSDLLARL
jgi:hypothetical protein